MFVKTSIPTSVITKDSSYKYFFSRTQPPANILQFQNNACADSGSTDLLIKKSQASAVVIDPSLPKLRVQVASVGTTIQSVAAGKLTIPGLDQPLKAYIFPDNQLHQSLYALAEFCNDHQCIVTLHQHGMEITRNGIVILSSSKNPTAKSWELPLPQQSPPSSPLQTQASSSTFPISNMATSLSTPHHCYIAQALVELPTDQARQQWLHATMGSPAASTYKKALPQFLRTLPGSSFIKFSKHWPHMDHRATDKGHLDQCRQPNRSIKANIRAAELSSLTDTDMQRAIQHMYPPPPTGTAYVAVQSFDLDDINSTMHVDASGRFPYTAKSGVQYILYFVTGAYIHLEGLRSRASAEYIAAYTRALAFFHARGVKPSFLRLDNETSKPLETFLMQTHHLHFQYVPPGTHRALNAERNGRTAKNHLIATLCSTDPDFPIDQWDKALPQVEITLNMMRPSQKNPSVSAFEALYGAPYNFVLMRSLPSAPRGTHMVSLLFTSAPLCPTSDASACGCHPLTQSA